MAKIRTNPIIQGLSGSLGGQIMFRHLRDGRTIVCARPDFSRRKFSREQEAHQGRFWAAAAYARVAARTQPVYAELAAGTLKTVYNLALADWFHPPEIQRIEKVGNSLRIWASDDVRVVEVRVTILDGQGRRLEGGAAAQADETTWEYVPTLALPEGGRAVVEAQDLAGNVTQAETELG